MASWILVPCLVKLRSEFDDIAPKRDNTSDGSIGDGAHQASQSDHNDDEVGNVPIRDADSTHEVHAIDVDVDLREPGLTMEQVVQFLLGRCRSGAERRLRYMIYNGRIWSASEGWRQQFYVGPNPHDHHAHFSASYVTALEASTASWHLEDLTMALDSTDKAAIRTIVSEEVAEAWRAAITTGGGSRDGALTTMLARTSALANQMVPALASAIAQIVPQDIDEVALAAALAARLPDDADDISADELRQAIVEAARELLGPSATA